MTALAPQPGIARDLRHAFCAGDVAKRCCDERRIAFLECGLKIRRNIFLGLKVFGGVPRTGFNILATMLS